MIFFTPLFFWVTFACCFLFCIVLFFRHLFYQSSAYFFSLLQCFLNQTVLSLTFPQITDNSFFSWVLINYGQATKGAGYNLLLSRTSQEALRTGNGYRICKEIQEIEENKRNSPILSVVHGVASGGTRAQKGLQPPLDVVGVMMDVSQGGRWWSILARYDGGVII